MSDLPSMAQIAASAGVPMPTVFNSMPQVQLPMKPVPIVHYGYEKVLAMIGLGHPLTRAVAGFTVAGAAMFTLRPDWAFDRKGHPRPWSIGMIGHAAKDGTQLPWWMVCVASAVGAALFL